MRRIFVVVASFIVAFVVVVNATEAHAEPELSCRSFAMSFEPAGAQDLLAPEALRRALAGGGLTEAALQTAHVRLRAISSFSAPAPQGEMQMYVASACLEVKWAPWYEAQSWRTLARECVSSRPELDRGLATRHARAAFTTARAGRLAAAAVEALGRELAQLRYGVRVATDPPEAALSFSAPKALADTGLWRAPAVVGCLPEGLGLDLIVRLDHYVERHQALVTGTSGQATVLKLEPLVPPMVWWRALLAFINDPGGQKMFGISIGLLLLVPVYRGLGARASRAQRRVTIVLGLLAIALIATLLSGSLVFEKGPIKASGPLALLVVLLGIFFRVTRREKGSSKVARKVPAEPAASPARASPTSVQARSSDGR
jgi:hypothetical protein